ncbi:DUF308 domain-containing protein [Laribacter hongkongensis]|uniref:HdeD family acid-resistance protein n=1 Tax=Laribacter hongkongensis TaxID=168471 RepID=UPI001EFCFA8A|nr:DUF308 domain-containing protein [Laribacter hongkongensis]MCG9055259.1 DUF308 domain-containing protein [Laribacter hongkongensis]
MPVSLPTYGQLTHRWGWLVALGIVQLLIGTVGLVISTLFTVASVLAFGAILCASGILTLLSAVFHGQGWKARGVSILISLMYLAAGLVMLFAPLLSAEWLTLMLAGWLIAVGFMRAVKGWQHRPEHGYGWVVLGGVLVFVSGVLLLMSWPGSGFWVIGLFISAELIFAGWTSIIVALAARRAAHNQPPHPDHEAGTPAGLAG